jgi:hypothetical protein
MKVTILQPTQHDETKYTEGDTADLPRGAAEVLIACGSAEPAGRASRPADGTPPERSQA